MRLFFCPASILAPRRAQAGFTLFEMLVVLAIVAAVAGVGIQVMTGVTDDSERALARAEMDNIASAIQRFHRDTGYWPKEGPFNVAAYAHPANLSQLRTAPVDAGNPVLAWDIASGTGWNGPYLRELDAAQVTVGPMNTDGSGDPGTGASATVSGIGDSFADVANAAGNFEWQNAAGGTIAQLGRPYLYFIDTATIVTGCQVPCIVSMGPDREYNQGGGDDIVVNIAGHQ